MKKLAVIGCGNMASALISGMETLEIEFLTYTPSKTRADELAKKVGGRAVEKLEDLAEADTFLLGFKPQQLEEFLKESGDLLANKNIISILTAVNMEILQTKFKTKQVMRIMPNTPSLIGEGVLLASHTKDFEDSELVLDWFQNCGEVVPVTENQLDELTVFTGSGPAYVYYFAREYVRLLEARGYSEALSRKMMDQLFVGSSKLMHASTESLDDLLAKVTSKGGVTIEAIKSFEETNLSSQVDSSIKKADARNQELLKAAKTSLK